MRGSTRRVMFIGGAVLVTTLLLGGVALALAVGGTVVGAPDHAVVRASGDVRWILPGSRQLDPDIFGTPDKPLGFEPGVGVPIEARNVSADGTEFTATKQPGPFSDNWAQVSGGSWIRVTDRTAVAGPSTEDRIRGEFRFTSPDGEHDYRLVMRRTLSQLGDHENFGGVGLNVVQHGRTGIGTKLMPQVFAYMAFWGVADLYRDGELVAENQFVHYMLTDQVRDIDDNYSLGFDEDVTVGDLQAHLILPPIEVTATGPVPRPVPTGFTLPNNKEQPFLHIMYEEIQTLAGD